MNSFETVTIENAEVGDRRYNKVIKKIERAARLAAKHGVPAPKLLNVREFVDKEFIDHPAGECQQMGVRGFWRYFTSVELTLDRKMVKVNGYTPVAHIDRDGIISRICDESLMTDDDLIELRNDREANFVYCDHCKTSRRRSMVIVCRNDETGELVSFGKKCLKVVTGLHITDSFLNPRSFNLDDDLDCWIIRESSRFTAQTILAVGLYVIKTNGYISNAAVRDGVSGPSTSDMVKMILGERETMYSIFDAKNPKVSDDQVSAVARWVTDHEGSSNYITNLKLIFGLDFVQPSHIGYIVSAIASKQREDNRREAAKDQPESHHVGTVGERLYKKNPTNAKVSFVRYMSNDWGSTTLLKFVTDTGAVLTWFASGYYEVEAGDTCTINGATVKRHTEYNGNKETAVNRVKLEWAS